MHYVRKSQPVKYALPRRNPKVSRENDVLVELLRRMTLSEKVIYIDRLLARTLRNM